MAQDAGFREAAGTLAASQQSTPVDVSSAGFADGIRSVSPN